MEKSQPDEKGWQKIKEVVAWSEVQGESVSEESRTPLSQPGRQHECGQEEKAKVRQQGQAFKEA
jgi:hypothetical protein